MLVERTGANKTIFSCLLRLKLFEEGSNSKSLLDKYKSVIAHNCFQKIGKKQNKFFANIFLNGRKFGREN